MISVQSHNKLNVFVFYHVPLLTSNPVPKKVKINLYYYLFTTLPFQRVVQRVSFTVAKALGCSPGVG